MVNNSKFYKYILYNRETKHILHLIGYNCCNKIMSRSTFNKMCNGSKYKFKGYILEKLVIPIKIKNWTQKKHNFHIFKITV